MSIDLNHIHPRHNAIDRRLNEWSRWVKVRPVSWATAPMFRLYRAPKQWESDLDIRIEINTLDAAEVERAVGFLPDKHRTAIRWSYVFPHVPVLKVRGELGVNLRAVFGDGYSGANRNIKTLLPYAWDYYHAFDACQQLFFNQSIP